MLFTDIKSKPACDIIQFLLEVLVFFNHRFQRYGGGFLVFLLHKLSFKIFFTFLNGYLLVRPVSRKVDTYNLPLRPSHYIPLPTPQKIKKERKKVELFFYYPDKL